MVNTLQQTSLYSFVVVFFNSGTAEGVTSVPAVQLSPWSVRAWETEIERTTVGDADAGGAVVSKDT